MKPDQVYQQLVEIAEKLGIEVTEKNLRNVGIKVRSGLCKVRDRQVYIMDKHAATRKKIKLLAACLGQMPLEEVYVKPAVREVIQKYTDRSETKIFD